MQLGELGVKILKSSGNMTLVVDNLVNWGWSLASGVRMIAAVWTFISPKMAQLWYKASCRPM